MYKKIDLSDCVFFNVSEDCAKGFIDWRIKIKKPLTQRAFKMALTEAQKHHTLGLTPDEALDKTIYWGWQAPCVAFAAERLNRELMAGASSMVKPRTTREMSLAENLTDRSWADEPLKLN